MLLSMDQLFLAIKPSPRYVQKLYDIYKKMVKKNKKQVFQRFLS